MPPCVSPAPPLTACVDVAQDNDTFTLEKFVAVQEKHVEAQTRFMSAKNEEIEMAVVDLVALVAGYPLTHTSESVDEEDLAKLRLHFSTKMYDAVLECTQNSLNLIKQRISARPRTGVVGKPFFDVGVELQLPDVLMNPPLTDIQGALNRTSRAVLNCSKGLQLWQTAPEDQKSIYEVVTHDREVVRTVLLLTGTVEGAKRQVFEYLRTFTKYDHLRNPSPSPKPNPNPKPKPKPKPKPNPNLSKSSRSRATAT